MIAGSHPFEARSVPTMMVNILHVTADYSKLAGHPNIVPVLGRLMARNPEDRYTNAGEVIAALCKATGHPMPEESITIRESFLQSARFVGRDSERDQLFAVLRLALQGQGGAWLVGGESGVGKTRLLDEIRTLALVKGALVARGHSVPAGGSPYELWRDVLPLLVLQTELTDLEAGVLKTLLPNISDLIDRQVPDAPALEPESTRDRLLTVIEDVVSCQQQPVVIILEDLQWIGDDSLAVVKRLLNRVQTQSVLILGSYRDDERPDLPAELPSMNLLRLDRLTDGEVQQLSKAMLGAAGENPEVLSLLLHETEGNTFFIVEVMRTLAEEVGQLDLIGRVELPTQILAVGMEAIIERRLSRVPSEAVPLLQIAAVAGRQVDPVVLRMVKPGIDLDAWTTRCANAAILNVQDGVWVFSHNKLREGVLSELEPERRKVLHRLVAEAIEEAYPNGGDKAANLAYHWRVAGDDKRELHYATLAGRQSLTNGVYKEAVKWLTRAKELVAVASAPEEKDETQLEEAVLERQIGEALIGLGQLDEGKDHLLRSLLLLERPLPQSGASLFLALARELLRQILHQIRLPRLARLDARAKSRNLEAARAYYWLVTALFFSNETLPAVYSAVHVLNLTEQTELSPERAIAYAMMCITTTFGGFRSVAEYYRKAAVEAAHAVNQPTVLAIVQQVTALYSAGMGRWELALEALEQAVDINTRVGAWQRWGETVAILSQVKYYQGDLVGNAEVCEQLSQVAHRNGNAMQKAWGIEGQALSALRFGHIDQAIKLFEEAIPSLVPDIGASISANGLLAVARLYQGENKLALELADKTAALIAQSSLTHFATVEGYAGVAEVYLTLYETRNGLSSADRDKLRGAARRACKVLRAARIFPINQPAIWLWQGVHHWIEGRTAQAEKTWRKSLACAEELGIPYDQGRAHYQIGYHLAVEHPARHEHLARAVQIFETLGTIYDLQCAQNALGQPS
jgi:tetratricopeptide (TPR) repeat protein